MYDSPRDTCYLKYSEFFCPEYHHVYFSHHFPAKAGIVEIKGKEGADHFIRIKRHCLCFLFAFCDLPGSKVPDGFAFIFSLLSSTAQTWLEKVQKRWSFSYNKHPTSISHPNAKGVLNVTLWEMKKSQLKVNWNASFFSSSLFVYFFSPLGLPASCCGHFFYNFMTFCLEPMQWNATSVI